MRQVYTPITAMMNAAARLKLCSPLKFHRPKVAKTPVRWLTHEEADSLIKACPAHLAPLVAFLFYTGARMGEALWIDWRFPQAERHALCLSQPGG